MRYDSLWAKKEEKDGQYYWLPLNVHLKDTGMVAGWLWNQWLNEGQRKYLISQMKRSDISEKTSVEPDESIAESLIKFIGAVHDIGKATPAFQVRRGFTNALDLDELLIEKLENSGFNGISDLKLANPEKSHHALAGEVILNNFGIRDDIASIVGAHHGKPVDENTCEFQLDAYPKNYYQYENVDAEGAKKWEEAHAFFLKEAFCVGGLTQDDLPEISEPGQVMISGLLIMADWIASNTMYFPLFPIEKDSVSQEEMELRFKDGMLRWYENLPHEVKKSDSADSLYLKRFGFEPRDFQRVIFECIEGLTDPGIVVIEAPTGGGKTEAALAAAEQLSAVANRSGLFFGLPTQATTDGIFDRICEWTQKLSHEYGETSIQLVHGKAALNKTMQEIRKQGAASVDIDEEDSGTVLVNEWFTGKKTAVLDDFVVGTVDQFLLMALKQKHFALRHLGFSRKVIVIDEVHAYDAYMQQYLKRALRWIGAYQVPVILLSATLPSQIRNDLIVEYMKGRGTKTKEIKSQLPISVNTYPMLTVSDGDKILRVTDFKKEEDKKIQVRDLADDMLFDKISDMLHDGGVIGVIVNTVKRAQEIAIQCAEMFGQNCVELVHASFIATDRVDLEKKILSMIGKGAKRPEKKIIIGTQVLEQSLDIDFDVLITDLCPMDLLIQRIGRLHRHHKDHEHNIILRPAGHAVPVVYVLGTSEKWEFNKGSRSVYGDYLLARTQEILPEELCIPSDVSILVQKVYNTNDESDNVKDESLKKRYEEFKKKFESDQINKESKAQTFRIKEPKLRINPKDNNMIGMLQSYQPSEEVACAQVRDTHETIEVIALRQLPDGYCTFKEGKNLAYSIEDVYTGRTIAEQTLRIPYSVTAGKTKEVIEELEDYNRKYLSAWQNNPWLKGSLGVLFDDQNQFIIGGKKLQYGPFLGLRVIKEGENEQI